MLYGRPAREPAKILWAAGQVGPEAVSDTARQLLGQMIVATPQLVGHPGPDAAAPGVVDHHRERRNPQVARFGCVADDRFPGSHADS